MVTNRRSYSQPTWNSAKRDASELLLSSGHSTSPGKKHSVAKIPSCMQEYICTCIVIQATDTGHTSFKRESGRFPLFTRVASQSENVAWVLTFLHHDGCQTKYCVYLYNVGGGSALFQVRWHCLPAYFLLRQIHSPGWPYQLPSTRFQRWKCHFCFN